MYTPNPIQTVAIDAAEFKARLNQPGVYDLLDAIDHDLVTVTNVTPKGDLPEVHLTTPCKKTLAFIQACCRERGVYINDWYSGYPTTK